MTELKAALQTQLNLFTKGPRKPLSRPLAFLEAGQLNVALSAPESGYPSVADIVNTAEQKRDAEARLERAKFLSVYMKL